MVSLEFVWKIVFISLRADRSFSQSRVRRLISRSVDLRESWQTVSSEAKHAANYNNLPKICFKERFRAISNSAGTESNQEIPRIAPSLSGFLKLNRPGGTVMKGLIFALLLCLTPLAAKAVPLKV